MIQGNLQDVALSSLLQAMHVDSVSGYLRVEGGGVLHIVDGEVVGASTAGAEGYEAVMSLLARRRGSFTFERGSPAGAEPLAPIMNLLLESARLDDEWRRVADYVVRVADRTRVPSDEPCLAALLQWVDGRRTIEEVAHLSGDSTTEIVASVRVGIRGGVLARVRSAESAGSSREPEPDKGFDDLIASARAKIRDGDLEGAARHLHRALARRPEDRIARQNLRRVASLLSSRSRRSSNQ